MRHPGGALKERGFTIAELALVVVIIGLAVGLVSTRLGVVDSWRESAAFKKLADTIVFINNQAVMDQVYYRMEFDLEKRQYRIGVMRPDGSGERILSESFAVEGPTFAPNGRVLMFWRESPARDARGTGFSSRLVSIDITGFNERPVSTPTDASDPAWSPLAS